MREIKFRAWNSRLNKIHDWESVKTFGSFSSIETHLFLTFMQYTGLKDKNGKEIYEGDVIEFNKCDYQRTAGHLDDDIVVAEVEYSCGAWGLKEANGQLHDLYISLVNDEEAEIIGNRFKNPELLEGDNNE